MSARLVLVWLLSFLGMVFIAIIYNMYIFMTKKEPGKKSLMEEAVNEDKNTDKMGIGEFLVYTSMILVALLFGLQIMDKGGSGFSNLAKSLIVPPVMALFNARKRTGKTIFLFMVAAIFSLYIAIVYIIVGLPVKTPVFAINNTKIIMDSTTVADLAADGFDIYVKEKDRHDLTYEDLLTSGAYVKYNFDKNIFIEKGFEVNVDPMYTAQCLLVKDGIVLGGIDLFGSKTEDIVLEDSKVVQLKIDEKCIEAAKAKSISFSLDGFELKSPLKATQLREKFNEKLWLVPENNTIDTNKQYYGIRWVPISDHLFWNEYYVYIDFDENNNMTHFELITEVARDKNGR